MLTGSSSTNIAEPIERRALLDDWKKQHVGQRQEECGG